jgi:hypothetical protein
MEPTVWIPFLSAIIVTGFGVLSTWLNNRHNLKIEAERRKHERQLEELRSEQARQLEQRNWQRQEQAKQQEAKIAKKAAQDAANRTIAESALKLMNYFRSDRYDIQELTYLIANAEPEYIEAYALVDPRVEPELNNLYSAIVATHPTSWLGDEPPDNVGDDLHTAISKFLSACAGKTNTSSELAVREPTAISTEDTEDMPF